MRGAWGFLSLGRRNLTPEQKSYLRGKRYHLEKKQGERTDLTSPENQEKSTTAHRLADEYKVSRNTIEKDGQFAEAVDTLEKQVRQDIRQAVLQRQSRAGLCPRHTRHGDGFGPGRHRRRHQQGHGLPAEMPP